MEVEKQDFMDAHHVNRIVGLVGDEPSIIDAVVILQKLESFVKSTKKILNERIIETFKDQKISQIEYEIFDSKFLILVSSKKTNRFDTKTIYDVLEFTEEQIDVLPKNPSFRKTAILKNEKTAIAWSEDIDDKVEVKNLDKAFLKH